MALNLGTLNLNIRADVKKAQAGLELIGKEVSDLNKKLGRVDSGAKGFKSLEQTFGKLGIAAKRVRKGIGAAGIAIAAVAAGTVAAVKAVEKLTEGYVKFEKSIAEVSTLVDSAKVSNKELEDSVKSLTKQFGGTLAKQSEALYQAISAGAEAGAESTELLTQANKLAVAGVTDVETAVDGLTSVLNAYGKDASEAGKVSDFFFTTVKDGKIKVEDIAKQIGKLASSAANAGVKLPDLGAALAQITKAGVNPAIAITQLRAALQGIIAPGEKAKKAIASIKDITGIEFNAKKLKDDGLVKFFNDLKSATDGNAQLLSELFPNIRAIGAVMGATAQGADVLNESLRLQADAAGATDEAFQKMSKTVAFQQSRFKALREVMGVTFGKVLKDSISFQGILKATSGIVEEFTTKIKELGVSSGSSASKIERAGQAVTAFFNLIRASIKLVSDLTAVARTAIQVLSIPVRILTGIAKTVLNLFTLIVRGVGVIGASVLKAGAEFLGLESAVAVLDRGINALSGQVKVDTKDMEDGLGRAVFALSDVNDNINDINAQRIAVNDFVDVPSIAGKLEKDDKAIEAQRKVIRKLNEERERANQNRSDGVSSQPNIIDPSSLSSQPVPELDAKGYLQSSAEVISSSAELNEARQKEFNQSKKLGEQSKKLAAARAKSAAEQKKTADKLKKVLVDGVPKESTSTRKIKTVYEEPKVLKLDDIEAVEIPANITGDEALSKLLSETSNIEGVQIKLEVDGADALSDIATLQEVTLDIKGAEALDLIGQDLQLDLDIRGAEALDALSLNQEINLDIKGAEALEGIAQDSSLQVDIDVRGGKELLDLNNLDVSEVSDKLSSIGSDIDLRSKIVEQVQQATRGLDAESLKADITISTILDRSGLDEAASIADGLINSLTTNLKLGINTQDAQRDVENITKALTSINENIEAGEINIDSTQLDSLVEKSKQTKAALDAINTQIKIDASTQGFVKESDVIAANKLSEAYGKLEKNLEAVKQNAVSSQNLESDLKLSLSIDSQGFEEALGTFNEIANGLDLSAGVTVDVGDANRDLNNLVKSGNKILEGLKLGDLDFTKAQFDEFGFDLDLGKLEDIQNLEIDAEFKQGVIEGLKEQIDNKIAEIEDLNIKAQVEAVASGGDGASAELIDTSALETFRGELDKTSKELEDAKIRKAIDRISTALSTAGNLIGGTAGKVANSFASTLASTGSPQAAAGAAVLSLATDALEASESFQELKGEVQGVFDSLFQAIEPVISIIANALIPIVQALAKLFEFLGVVIQKVVGVISKIGGGAVSLITKPFKALGSKLGGATKALGGFIGGLFGFSTAIKGNPLENEDVKRVRSTIDDSKAEIERLKVARDNAKSEDEKTLIGRKIASQLAKQIAALEEQEDLFAGRAGNISAINATTARAVDEFIASFPDLKEAKTRLEAVRKKIRTDSGSYSEEVDQALKGLRDSVLDIVAQEITSLSGNGKAFGDNLDSVFAKSIEGSQSGGDQFDLVVAGLDQLASDTVNSLLSGSEKLSRLKQIESEAIKRGIDANKLLGDDYEALGASIGEAPRAIQDTIAKLADQRAVNDSLGTDFVPDILVDSALESAAQAILNGAGKASDKLAELELGKNLAIENDLDFSAFDDAINSLNSSSDLQSDAAGELSKAASQLTNVPQGFKIALARFDSTIPALEDIPKNLPAPILDASSINSTGSAASGLNRAETTNNNTTVNQGALINSITINETSDARELWEEIKRIVRLEGNDLLGTNTVGA